MPTITGTAGNDTVYRGGGKHQIYTIDGDDVGPGVLAQEITGTEDDDSLFGTEEADVINGLGGDDFIDGSLGDDLLSGGDGNDTLYGSHGDDELLGGGGSDLLIGGLGADLIDGGDGIDTAYYADDSAGPVAVNIGQAGSASSGGPVLVANSSLDEFGASDSLVSIENVVTGFGDDIILGNEGANRLNSGNGVDVIDGRGGDDFLEGGYYGDTLTGGAGNDIFSGTTSDLDEDVITDIELGDRIHITDMFMDNFQLSISGNKLIFPGGFLTLANILSADFTVEASPDGGIWITIISTSIEGTAGNDTLNGTADDDVIYAFDGNDTLNGLGGDDLLNGGLGDDILNGDAGIDTATYVDAASGVTVNLTISGAQNTGGYGTDTLNGIENLIGSSFNDTLVGNSGSNMFIGHAGDDSIDGGDGFDTVDYSRESGLGRVYVNLSSAPFTTAAGEIVQPGRALDANGDTDTLTSIEHIITGDSNDYVWGSDRDERIETGGERDTLIGGGGADVLIGGAGDDWYVNVSLAEGDQLIELADGGYDEIYSLDQTFSLVGFENFELLAGLLPSGHDFTGNALDNVISGNAGSDTIRGAAGDDYLSGGSGNDFLYGGDGFDILTGNNGADTLFGDSGNDTLSGSAGDDLLTDGSGIDRLTGGTGLDIFRDSAAGLNGDTITDLTASDRLVISDATLAGFTFSVSGNTLTYTGGSLTLSSVPAGSFIARAAAGGGVELLIADKDVRNDFNGDGRSDILWRNVDGQLSNWLGQANGGFVANNANAAAVVPVAWQVAGTGDFNGDGRDDILWRNVDGQLSNWLGTANGGFTPNNANAAAVVPVAWQVVGTGDFNGDGRDDILWRNTDGTVSDWLGTAAGGFTANDANAARFVPTDWHVVGTGDFNGDGRDDVLWRNTNGQVSDWLGQSNGGFLLNDAVALTNVATSWHVVGTGDFNGDGRDDILWRNDNGQLSNWLGQANGGFVNNGANSGTLVPTAWSVVAVGDYNGDGRDDILWRHTDGTLSNWLGTATGGFTPNDSNAATPVPTSWEVQPEPFLL